MHKNSLHVKSILSSFHVSGMVKRIESKMLLGDNVGEDESETFSDIDDRDVDVYLHNEEGKRIKKILWERVNQEYRKEQAIMEAAAAALEKTFEAIPEARELAASVMAKSRNEMKQRRAREAKNIAQISAESVGQISNGKKGLKSKVNYDRLNELFNELKNTDDAQEEDETRPASG